MVTPIFLLGYVPLTLRHPLCTRRVGSEDLTCFIAFRASSDRFNSWHQFRNSFLSKIMYSPYRSDRYRPSLFVLYLADIRLIQRTLYRQEYRLSRSI